MSYTISCTVREDLRFIMQIVKGARIKADLLLEYCGFPFYVAEVKGCDHTPLNRGIYEQANRLCSEYHTTIGEVIDSLLRCKELDTSFYDLGFIKEPPRLIRASTL